MKHRHRFEIMCLACRAEESFLSKAERSAWKWDHRQNVHGQGADFVEWEADIQEPPTETTTP